MKKKEFLKRTRITLTERCHECGAFTEREAIPTEHQWKVFKKLLWYHEYVWECDVHWEARLLCARFDDIEDAQMMLHLYHTEGYTISIPNKQPMFEFVINSDGTLGDKKLVGGYGI